MATAIFTDWFRANSSSLETSGSDLGLTLFARCPQISEDDSEASWNTVVELDELLQSDHWQAPSFFVQDESGAYITAQQEVAATAEYFIDFQDGRYFLRFADPDEGFVIGTTPAWGESELSPTGSVINGLAIWYAGTIGTVTNPVLTLIELGTPVLLMATDDQPTLLKAPLIMSWSTLTPGVSDGRYGMTNFGSGTYGGGS